MNVSHLSRCLRPAVAALATALALSAFLAGVAGAANNGQFSVEPATGEGFPERPFFVYNLDPGGRVEDAITVSNLTDAPITFLLYSSDARPNPDGAFALGNPDSPKVDLGTWIQLPTDRITVPAMTAANIPFTLTVPTDAISGDHAGGIIALNEAVRSGDQNADTGDAVTIAGRDGVGARIYVRVTGPAEPSLALSSVSLSTSDRVGFRFGAPSAGTVTYKVVNTGNVRVAPTATVSVQGPLGLGKQTLEPRDLPELLPGASVTITEPVDSLPPLGLLTATVNVKGATADAGEVSARGEGRALAVPWYLLLLLAVVIVAVVAWRRRSRRPPASPAPVDGGEDPLVPVGVTTEAP